MIEKSDAERLHETVFATIVKQYPNELSKEEIIKILNQCDLASQTIREFLVQRPLPEVKCL